jgi:predicted nucleotidyltransferase
MNIAPEHLRIVEDILKSHLPAGASVAVFGSRATGRAKPFSDLDLAIDAGRPLTLVESADLREAFTESDLPWKVDFLDRHAAQAHFLRVIEARSLALIWSGA